MNRTFLAAALVLTGAALMTYCLSLGARIRDQIPAALRGRWRVVTALMAFFLVGYVLFVVALFGHIALSPEMVTASVFLGGAVFVYLLIRMMRSSLECIGEQKARLEKEVTERELRQRERLRYQKGLEKLDHWTHKLVELAGDPAEFYELLCRAGCDFVAGETAVLTLCGEDGGHCVRNEVTLAKDGRIVDGPDPLALRCLDEGVPLRVAGRTMDRSGRESSSADPDCALVVPLHHQGQVAAALSVYRHDRHFDDVDEQILRFFSQRASIALANMRILCGLEDRVRSRTDELAVQNKLLENIIANIPSIVFWKDTEAVYQGCNPGFLRLCGAGNPWEVVGHRDDDLAWLPEFRDALQAAEKKVLHTGQAILDREMNCRDGRGRELTCLNSWIPLKDGYGELEGVLGIFKDISARKQAEDSLQRVNRSLETLSSGSAAIVRATTEEQLLGQVCRIIVQTGQYAHAWVVTSRDEVGTVFRCATGVGTVQDTCQIPLEDHALPVRTIRSGEVQMEKDFQPVAGGEKGSLLALPLLFGGESRGALVIYAGSSSFFDQQEVQLLTDLTGHLAHGISALREAQRRQEAEKAVADERRFLQMVIDGVVDPIMVIGTDYRVVHMNRAARSFLPESWGARDGLCCYQVYHGRSTPCPAENGPCPVIEVPRRRRSMTMLHSHTFDDGNCRVFEMESSPLWRADGALEGIIESSRDITERLRVEENLRENKERLDYLAHHDTLTGLPNRLLFHDRLNHALTRAQREEVRVALLFLDLDRFKTINDTLGHENGDKVLREVAARLKSILRSSDTVARLGGDEFVVLIECCREVSEASGVARKILEIMAEGLRIDDHDLHLTTSIGISLYPDDARDLEGLVKFADQAMYRAKDEGRNNYQFFRPEMNRRSHELLALENSLRKALVEEQLTVYYQPQYDLESRALIGFEALVRWNHPQRGMVSPGDFIPLAEESGLIVPMGEWILRTVCTQTRAWQREGLPAVRVAVNISACQFRQADFVDMVERALADAELDPDWLELEITEGIAMQNVDETIMTLTDLKIRGIHLAIDDFGTGYSSLNYLKRFPISKLKIDQAFVRDIAGDPHDAAIVGAVIALGRSLNLEVIAEGVETEDQVLFLTERGCRQAQGYLFSRPLPAEDCRALLLAAAR